jgi:hypothetical protein
MGTYVGADGDEYSSDEETPEPQPTRVEQASSDLREMMADAPEEAPAPTAAEAAAVVEEMIRLGDREIPASMAPDVTALIDWAASLTPEQYEAINRVLQGDEPEAEYEEEEVEEYEEPDFSDLDEDTANYLRRQQEEIQRVEAELQARAAEIDSLKMVTGEAIYNRQRIEGEEVEQQVKAQFLEEHSLTEEDYPALIATATQLGITPAMVQKLGLEQGFKATLDAALYANPDLRNKTLRTSVEQEVRQSLNAGRKADASALAPQGGTSIPSQAPSNLPVSEKQQAMRREIQDMLNNQ